MSNGTMVVHQQEKIMNLLKTYANEKGYVKGLDIDRMSRLSGITHHDVTKTLWGLQKRNLVGFSEKKGTGGSSIPFRFRVKKQGFAAGAEEVREAEPIEKVEPEAQPVITAPKQRDHIRELLNRENDLRFAADLLGDYGLEELGLKVLEHVKLSNDEYNQLKQYYE